MIAVALRSMTPAAPAPQYMAIGDAVRGPMLAHKASEEGDRRRRTHCRQQPQLDHHLIPWVIYTHPEIAWVGDTEHSAKQAGVEVRTGSFPYRAVGER